MSTGDDLRGNVEQAPEAEPALEVGLVNTVRTVFRKEARDHLRDRRSVLGALLLPLLGPGMLIAGVRVHTHLREQEERALPVIGAAHAPSLTDAIVSHGVRITTLDRTPEEAVTNGDELAVLVIAEDYQQRLSSGKPANVRLVFDSSKPKSSAFARRVEIAIGTHAQTLASLRLISRGVAPSVAQPVRIQPIDVATPEQIAAQLLTAIPIMLMLAAVAGGLNIAIDTTAGERERRSLEPLLLNPASRLGIVVGKWLTTACAGMLVCAIATVGFLIVHPQLPLDEFGLRVQFGLFDAVMMLVWIAPLAGVGAALQMLIAGFAKTFKEAQTYLSVFILLPTLPAVFLMFSPMQNTWWACLVPALAQVTAILDILRGGVIPQWHLVLTWVSSLLYTALTLTGLERLLRREQTIFGR